MGKIYVLMGKSATGKDTVYNALKQRSKKELRKVVEYTTRPMRENEVDGVAYHFVTPEMLEDFRTQGKVIECRTYPTIHGPWSYFNVDDGQIDYNNHDYLLITTLEGYCGIKAFFPEGVVVPLYLQISDRTRMHRAMQREDEQSNPKYAELCRRFLADDVDFAEDKIQAAGITKRYSNEELESCIAELLEEIEA